MARGIAVYRGADVEHLPNADWRLREGAEAVYDESLGSEAAVREFWSDPAARLGLPLFAVVYELGFYEGICWHASQLDTAEAELDRLEEDWHAAGLDAETLAELVERAGYLRKAAGLARGHGGIVLIS
jgi:hypothetical protein